MSSYDNTLDLGLGLSSSHNNRTNPKPQNNNVHGGEPCLTLSLSGEKLVASAASSMSNVVAVSVKREREMTTSSDDEEDGSCANINNNNNNNSSNNNNNNNSNNNNNIMTRKKLRLTKDQSAMLEESFKLQSTLNPKQKQALAERLDLLPRQVEVWFQNRRARTKLKQTEEDCEYMKKWCETLTDENKRLQKEVQELKALKLVQPFYMHLPTTTLSMCPSCEKIGPGGPITGKPVPVSKKGALAMGSKSNFYPARPNRPLLVDN